MTLNDNCTFTSKHNKKNACMYVDCIVMKLIYYDILKPN